MPLALEPLAPLARHVALSIGERLLDELGRDDFFDVNAEHYPSRRLNGSTGFALLFLALARLSGEHRFEAAMHAHLARAARAPGEEYGLFTGFAALRAVAALATAVEPRYANLVAKCDAVLDARVDDGNPDLIGGTAGIAVARTIGIARPLARDRDALYRALMRRDDSMCCGLAHGVPGILLALTVSQSPLEERERVAIEAAVSWLRGVARPRGGVPLWPRFTNDPADESPRSVWCYGTPGVALALLHVARATADAELDGYARTALTDLALLPRHELLMTKHGLCHGTMGNALVYYGAARVTGDSRYMEIASTYAHEAAGAMTRDGMRTVTRGRDGVPYDSLGHLNGIAGIALGLLTVAGLVDDEWTKIHGIAAV